MDGTSVASVAYYSIDQRSKITKSYQKEKGGGKRKRRRKGRRKKEKEKGKKEKGKRGGFRKNGVVENPNTRDSG